MESFADTVNLLRPLNPWTLLRGGLRHVRYQQENTDLLGMVLRQ